MSQFPAVIEKFLTAAPVGYGFWDAPRDGAARINHGAHEAPLSGLPSSLAWGSNTAKRLQHTKLDSREQMPGNGTW